MKSFVWIKKNKVASFLIIFVSVFVGYKFIGIGVQVAKGDLELKAAITFVSTNFLFLCLLFVCWVLNARARHFQHQIDWLIDATNWNISNLNTAQNSQADATGSIDKNAITDARWPWGKHHTETLGHLEAAARKWWVLYDPSDFTTAPTNEIVSEWLQTERGISKEKARAIASMLRPDGLPTGPRR